MISNAITTWGDERWYCITKNALSVQDKKALVEEYNCDKSSVNLNDAFFIVGY